MATGVIRFEDVSVKVRDESILKGISGDVRERHITALIGPSGAGKSTLLSLCNLLRTPSDGRVYVRDQEVRSWNVQTLRQTVGMVFQSATMFPGTVRENLEYGLKLRGRRGLDHPERLLQDIGLDESLLSKPAGELSGGQKQRVALGRTLATNADILLLDEITSALDVHARAEVENTVLELVQKRQTTVLWVTHDLNQAERVAHDIWYMQSGQLLEVSEASSFFTRPKTEEALAFLTNMGDGETE